MRHVEHHIHQSNLIRYDAVAEIRVIDTGLMDIPKEAPGVCLTAHVHLSCTFRLAAAAV